MSAISIAVLAFSLSLDAFLAALGRGSGIHQPDIGEALKTGAVFGIIEAITPILGWAAGVAASGFVQQVDHWIAFALLGLVGGNMIVQAWKFTGTRDERIINGSIVVLLATAIGTSIDAMAVGVTLAFLDANIIVMAVAVGLTTLVLSTIGMMAGRYIGLTFGRWAEAGGGLALVCLGTSILYSHLTA
jgi:putative Mn2+ efflux pump MntP